VLQRAGQRRFSGAGQASQPDHGTAHSEREVMHWLTNAR
jgi:hypothetical protein